MKVLIMMAGLASPVFANTLLYEGVLTGADPASLEFSLCRGNVCTDLPEAALPVEGPPGAFAFELDADPWLLSRATHVRVAVGEEGEELMRQPIGSATVAGQRIEEPLVLRVSSGANANAFSEFATIPAALNALERVQIGAAATVRIEVEHSADGVWTLVDPLRVAHSQWARVHLVGVGDVPVGLSFPNSSGIVVPQGSALGYVSGFRIEGNGAPGTVGIEAANGGSIGVGDLTVERFEIGFLATRGGSIVRVGGEALQATLNVVGVRAEQGALLSLAPTGGAASPLLVNMNTSHGLDVSGGSYAQADGVVAVENGMGDDDGNAQGNGVRVHLASAADLSLSGEAADPPLEILDDCLDDLSEPAELRLPVVCGNRLDGLGVHRGSTVHSPGLLARGNERSGVLLLEGSFGQLNGVRLIENVQDGLRVAVGSAARAEDSFAQRNRNHGFAAHALSTLLAPGSDARSNGWSGFFAIGAAYMEVVDSSSETHAQDGGEPVIHGAGYAALTGSVIKATRAVSQGNGVAFFPDADSERSAIVIENQYGERTPWPPVPRLE